MAAHPDVDAIVYLGIGHPGLAGADVPQRPVLAAGFGLERIGSFHEAQDRRYALAAAEARPQAREAPS